MDGRGLNDDGTIAREGSLDRVAAAFVPVVDAARAGIGATFDATRLHSAYLYGSVPRGTAIPGVSDLDVLLALRHEPTDADRADAATLGAAIDRAFSQIVGAGIEVSDTTTLLSDLERHDGGFWVACLCTPLLGDDIAAHLPRYRPTSLLARETNGDLALALPGWRARVAQATTGNDFRALSRTVGRRLVRTGFTLVMPRWGGWTSDLDVSTEIFGSYYPERAAQMRLAAALARTPTTDRGIFGVLIDDLADWLVSEYEAHHGVKAPRP